MADGDIFMDYVESESSSPMDSEAAIHQINLNFSRPNSHKTIEESICEKENLLVDIFTKNSSTSNRLKVLKLRQFNRNLSNEISDKRRRLGELKDKVDGLNSKLLCQKFEKQHLLDEIKACLGSKNIFETIELEPVESVDSSNMTEHELMIQRLHRELAKRQELQGKLVSILQKKKQTETELEAKKKKIDDLRNNLQILLKNSKPLVDACGYDLDALHKKKMLLDDETVAADVEIKNEEDGLVAIYEKLVNFVADRTDYKLRYFEGLTSDEQPGDDNDKDDEITDVLGRNPSIKSAYIQVNLQFTEVDLEPLNIFLSLHSSSVLLLTIQHELISENTLINWLKGLGTIEFYQPDQLNNCIAPLKIQPDSLNLVQDSESYDQVFTALKDALQLRHQIQCLLNSMQSENSLHIEFDKNNPNNLQVFNTQTNMKFTAQIGNNSSIIWSCEDEKSNELIASLNSFCSKYRSVLDCLQAQLDLLTKH